MNIEVTNMENNKSVIVTEKEFNTMKNLFSENSTYKKTSKEVNKINLSILINNLKRRG